VFRGRTFGQPCTGANLRKWESGLDRLDDLIPGETLRAPGPPPSARTKSCAFMTYTSSFKDPFDSAPTMIGESWLPMDGSL
jgi:hypothetical protein